MIDWPATNKKPTASISQQSNIDRQVSRYLFRSVPSNPRKAKIVTTFPHPVTPDEDEARRLVCSQFADSSSARYMNHRRHDHFRISRGQQRAQSQTLCGPTCSGRWLLATTAFGGWDHPLSIGSIVLLLFFFFFLHRRVTTYGTHQQTWNSNRMAPDSSQSKADQEDKAEPFLARCYWSLTTPGEVDDLPERGSGISSTQHQIRLRLCGCSLESLHNSSKSSSSSSSVNDW